MSDVRLDPITGDLDVTDFVGPRMFSRDELVNARAQRVRVNVRTFIGEWFMNALVGLPWLQQIIGSKDDALAVALIRDAIANVPGVKEVTSIVATRNRSSRVLVIRFSATTDVGVLDDEFTFTI